CDVDIVGSDSLLYEAELLCIYDQVFAALNLPVQIRINNRKILEGIARQCGFESTFRSFTVIIDKLDKIGPEKVAEELTALGGDASKAMAMLRQGKLDASFLTHLKDELKDEVGQKGIAELEELVSYIQNPSLTNEVIFDGTLARGLNYYTGTIYEVQALDVNMGSIGGGGRYDDLTGIFGLKGVSGVGVSFGADRIYDVLLEKGLFPNSATSSTQIIFCPMDDAALPMAFSYAMQCRAKGIATEVYPSAAKLKKQLTYANNNAIAFAAILGEEEIKTGSIALKDLLSGEQKTVNLQELIATLSA
ncbi:MAG: ATP phosphoribosyltransferase regulatory subunit, partial [Bacteroidota bacterium]|nr:ATP phosphoribosyltransferase regulatory subunit [Bacteroidota bacterium]MDX5430049.1 ATP phosphoribosyltransferase regulatory subunit [Bacteroidota bacterium]MDX5468819.1 ATP phosphoribosyltransferase regulatory subunit [Bacteroidota bacterium]